MGYDITNDCIIEEYLNNWFTYEELAQYLCLSVSRIYNVLDNIEDEKLSAKVKRHKSLIKMYYSDDKNEVNIEGYEDILEMADYIIEKYLV